MALKLHTCLFSKHLSLVIVLYSLLSLSCSSSTPTILCKPQDKAALLEFKNLFSVYPIEQCDDSYVLQWNEDSQDCCEWTGVECNYDTGYVISLLLDSSCLYGTIPTNSSLFNLTHLEVIYLEYNYLNNSRVSPLYSKLRNLMVLNLKESDLSGVVPDEIFQLPKLQTLDLSGNSRLRGTISGINATELISLDLSGTGFYGEIPDSIGTLKKLKKLSLSGCNFTGPIPESLGYLTELTILDLGNNSFSGKLPLSFKNLMNLTQLDLSYNNLQGPILDSVLKHKNYTQLFLSGNQFSDNVDLVLFTNLLGLEYLDLSNSGLSLTTTNPSFLLTFRSIRKLGLSTCDLNIVNKTIKIVSHLEVEAGPVSNGSLYVDLSNNKLNEQILDSVCKLNFFYLDLSGNQLSGNIPDCLFRSIRSLSMLKLGGNNFHGTIPQSVELAMNLKLLDLSDNMLEGNLPRSLANCSQLEVLNLGSNTFTDSFPSWLGRLPSLKILILRENKIYGEMRSTRGEFSNLRIIDVSQNDLTGTLPSEYFNGWDAMMVHDDDESRYAFVQTTQSLCDPNTRCIGRFQSYTYYYSLTITNKGSDLYYQKVFSTMKVVDFSGNQFNRQIPPSIGKLKGIQVLNLSSNALTGPIPNSIGNLSNLESLDLSSNMLSGEIPQEMGKLFFLGVFNISQNNLTGKLPQLGQLSTFLNTSYLGNPGLCGLPLSRLCSDPDTRNSPDIERASEDHQGFKFEVDDFGWETVSIGYMFGLVIGLILGYFIVSVTDKTWLVRNFSSRSRHSSARSTNSRHRRR